MGDMADHLIYRAMADSDFWFEEEDAYVDFLLGLGTPIPNEPPLTLAQEENDWWWASSMPQPPGETLLYTFDVMLERILCGEDR